MRTELGGRTYVVVFLDFEGEGDDWGGRRTRGDGRWLTFGGIISKEEAVIAGEETVEREGLKFWVRTVTLWLDRKWKPLWGAMKFTHLLFKASTAGTTSARLLRAGHGTLTSVGIVARKGKNPIESVCQGILHLQRGRGEQWAMAREGEKEDWMVRAPAWHLKDSIFYHYLTFHAPASR